MNGLLHGRPDLRLYRRSGLLRWPVLLLESDWMAEALAGLGLHGLYGRHWPDCHGNGSSGRDGLVHGCKVVNVTGMSL